MEVIKCYCDIFKRINMNVISLFEEIIICNSEICGDDNGVYIIDIHNNFKTQLKKITFKNCVLKFRTIWTCRCHTIQVEFINCTIYKPQIPI